MIIVAKNGLAASNSGADSLITRCLTLTGAIHWVDSQTGNDSNPGTENEPLATLAQAISNASADNGDVIVIRNGHAETISSSITVNKAGVAIFGIGVGSQAPRFTAANTAIDLLNITAPNVILNNLWFPAGTTAANASRINIDAAGVWVKGCTFLCGANDPDSITLTANAINVLLESLSMTVSADGPDTGIRIESADVDGLRVRDCAFNGSSNNWDLGAIYSSFAHTNYRYEFVTLTGEASIIHTAAAKGFIAGISEGTGSQVQV